MAIIVMAVKIVTPTAHLNERWGLYSDITGFWFPFHYHEYNTAKERAEQIAEICRKDKWVERLNFAFPYPCSNA